LSTFVIKFNDKVMKIVFATNNKHKLTEIEDLLGDSFILMSLNDVAINDEIPEDMPTLEGNALFKANYIHKATGMNVFADDTGLEVEELNGMPGVHSARFAGGSKDFKENTKKVLRLMENKMNRRAHFRTVIALIFNGKEYLFDGSVKGILLSKPRGNGGFGYDPIFVPDGEKRSFAEMSLSEKNRISHRAIAFEKLRLFLSQNAVADNNGKN
jgi:XTP/dITP diphosphohydrolase